MYTLFAAHNLECTPASVPLQKVMLSTAYKIMASAVQLVPDEDKLTGGAVVKTLHAHTEDWKKPNSGGRVGKASTATVKDHVRDW